MKKKNLILTLMFTALLLGGVNSEAKAQGSLFGRENNGSFLGDWWEWLNSGEDTEESLFSNEGSVEYYQSPTHTGGLFNKLNRGDGFDLGGVTNNEDPTAPLGSGIVILTVAGAGYALLKRKEEQQ